MYPVGMKKTISKEPVPFVMVPDGIGIELHPGEQRPVNESRH
jgi:hypothetical protein